MKCFLGGGTLLLAGHHNYIRPFDTLHISWQIRKLTLLYQFIMSNYMPYLMVISSSVCPESTFHLLWKCPYDFGGRATNGYQQTSLPWPQVGIFQVIHWAPHCIFSILAIGTNPKDGHMTQVRPILQTSNTEAQTYCCSSMCKLGKGMTLNS